MRKIQIDGAPLANGKVPVVCTPLVGRTREALAAEVAAVVPKRPDVVEWRVDFFEGIGRLPELLEVGRALRAAAGELP